MKEGQKFPLKSRFSDPKKKEAFRMLTEIIARKNLLRVELNLRK